MTSKEARNAYKRAWNRAHKEQVKSYQKKYWERKAAELDMNADMFKVTKSVDDPSFEIDLDKLEDTPGKA